MNVKGKHIRQQVKSACEGKTRFYSQRLAEEVRVRVQQRDSRRTGTTTYRCDFCGGWHFGRTPKRVTTKEAA